MIQKIIKSNGPAAFIALLSTLITWSYADGGSVLHPIVLVLFAVMAFVVFLVYFLITKMLINKFVNSDWLYPNFIFRTLFPFFIAWIFTFIVYCFIVIEPFATADYFVDLLNDFSRRTFLRTIIFGLAVCIVLTVTYKRPIDVPDNNNKKLQKNSLALLLVVAIFLAIMAMFYFINFIEQPILERKYENYENINKLVESDNFTMKLFLEGDEYYMKAVSPPYYRESTNEIILYFTYHREVSGRNQDEFILGYVINKEGAIVRSIDERSIQNSDNGFFPVFFRNGLIVDEWHRSVPKKAVTFLFDGDTLIKDFEAVSSNENWQIEKTMHDSLKVKTVSFFKTFALPSSENDIKYNGTMYYNILKDDDTLKMKIDSIYSNQDQGNHFTQKEVQYYECKNMNFSLVCFNQQKYYIIKHKNKSDAPK